MGNLLPLFLVVPSYPLFAADDMDNSDGGGNPLALPMDLNNGAALLLFDESFEF